MCGLPATCPFPSPNSAGSSRCGPGRPTRASACRPRRRASAIGWERRATPSPTSTSPPKSIARNTRRRSRSTSTPGVGCTSARSTSAAIPARATKSSGARCASSKAPGTTAPGSTARRSGSSASAISRMSTSRRRPFQGRPTRPTSRSPSWRRRRAACRRASATRAPTASCSARRFRSRTSSAPAMR